MDGLGQSQSCIDSASSYSLLEALIPSPFHVQNILTSHANNCYSVLGQAFSCQFSPCKTEATWDPGHGHNTVATMAQ